MIVIDFWKRNKIKYRSNKKPLEVPLQWFPIHTYTKTILFPITTKAAVCRHCW